MTERLDYRAIGSRVRELRLQHKMTQEYLAELVDISPSFIGHIERGEKKPSLETIITNPPIRAGKAVIYGLFDEASKRLNPGGQLFIVIRKQQGAPSALEHLRQRFNRAEVIDRSGGYRVIACGI